MIIAKIIASLFCMILIKELFPAVHYICRPEPRDNRMPLPSGLGSGFHKKESEKSTPNI